MPAKRGRPRTRSERDVHLAGLWGKLSRSTYAIADYDRKTHKYGTLTAKELKNLKAGCAAALDAVFKLKA